MNIGLIAHDAKKTLLQNLCIAYRSVLAKHTLYATGTSGRLVEEATGLNVRSGPGTGYARIKTLSPGTDIQVRAADDGPRSRPVLLAGGLRGKGHIGHADPAVLAVVLDLAPGGPVVGADLIELQLGAGGQGAHQVQHADLRLLADVQVHGAGDHAGGNHAVARVT